MPACEGGYVNLKWKPSATVGTAAKTSPHTALYCTKKDKVFHSILKATVF